MVSWDNKPIGIPILATITGMLSPSPSAPNSPATQHVTAAHSCRHPLPTMEIEIITIPVPQRFGKV